VARCARRGHGPYQGCRSNPVNASLFTPRKPTPRCTSSATTTCPGCIATDTSAAATCGIGMLARNWSILFPDRRDWFPLPFGAIVGTAVVAEVLPIFGMERIYDRPDRPPESAVPYIWYGLKKSDAFGATPLIGLDVERDAAQEDVSDQLPYGYWEAGRWAWRMTDPVMFDSPILCRGAQGVWRIPTGLAS
jgi:hypothetical protein